MKKRILLSGLLACSMIAMQGCATNPTMGGGQGGGTITGSAAGGSTDGKNSLLESCEEALGTVSVFEDTSKPWWSMYQKRAPDLGSTTPVIRLMIQQSGCFVVVERGAVFAAMQRERELMSSGESRKGSNFGKGQVVAADYTLSPSIQFKAKGTGGIGGVIGGLVAGSLGTAIVGGFKKNEAATTLLLIENRSGVQVSAAVGDAKNYDFSLFGGMFAGGAAGGVGGFSNTPEGKIITASFADSFNQMVKALRNYKAQQVKGGLGKGGRLKVGQ